MSTRYRSTRSSFGRLPASYSYRRGYRHDRNLLDSPFGFVLFAVGVVVAIGTIVMAIIGIVGVAGGFNPEYKELRYPKPDGYRLEGWRIQGERTMCIDPRGGPPVDWSLLDMAVDAVATWRAAAPSLPLTINGICKSAGGNAEADGEIRWDHMDGRWGEARGLSSSSGNIALNPEIPPSWDCVRNVLLHEAGHIIGLDHQSDDMPSVMNRAGCTHEISLLDVAAARYLYEGRAKK